MPDSTARVRVRMLEPLRSPAAPPPHYTPPMPPDDAQFSADYVRKVARLSRLALTDAEVDAYRTKLSAVVTYIERLRALDLSGIEPLANVADTVNRFRDDVPGPTLPNAAFMRMAPDTLPPFIKVPKVLGDGGGA